ncbi:hypothetical protein [Pengzhenrongella frigida]|uniref:DUF2510 domain-containing protein n=1 Tax=Pengzhenrongella frigida TaxID=1259133 RepID=A0A4Q5N2R4_9MICO|nr:hypothetical protein [Cellulomonas sp. HLT2-17]RYV50887.1 hypothetical protein EUA98_11520 [Cellulomonas sp. HLT2-17]
MTSAPGPALDPDETGPQHWWQGERWSRALTAVGSQLRPPAEEPLADAIPAATGAGFPFTRPWRRDWVFWWAMTLTAVLLVGFAVDVTNRYAGFNLSAWLIDSAIGLPLVFVVLVLPVAVIRALVRAQRTRSANRRAGL